MLAFAIDHHSPATVILIAGDRDYAYAMSTLRLRQYSVVLIVPPAQSTLQSLEYQASAVIDWNYAILGKRPDVDTPPVRQPYRDLDEDIFDQLAREIRDSSEDPAVTLISSPYLTSTEPAHTRHVSAAEWPQPLVFQRNTDPSDAVHSAPTCTPKRAASVFPGTPGHSKDVSMASHARSATVQSSHADSSGDTPPAPKFTVQNALETLGQSSRVRSMVPYASMTQFMHPDSIRPGPTCTTRGAASTFPDTPPGVEFVPSSSTTQSMQAIPVIDRDPGPFAENSTLSDGGDDIQDATYDPFTRPLVTNSQLRRYENTAEPSSLSILNFRSYPPSPVPAVTCPRTTPLRSSSYVHTIQGCTPVSHVLPTCRLSDVITKKSMNAGSVSAVMDDHMPPSDHAALMNALGLDYEDDNISDRVVLTYSPALTGVDDSSSADVVRSAESFLNGSRAYFDDIVKYPLANHTSESSGSPTSQKSSLTPSLSYSNVTMPNVGIGTRQTTSIIDDNNDNHSSGYQALPAESVEDKIRRLTPVQFFPLVNQLLLSRSNGIMRPSRSTVAFALFQHDENAYKRVGVNTFKDYTLLAEQAELIELGGRAGDAWMALHPNLFKEEINAPRSPSPPNVHRYSSFAPHASTSFTETGIASQAATPNPNTFPAAPDKHPFYFYPLITRR
jgi:hypothetical protein